MSHERDPILHGSHIGAGIGIRDIFDLHVSMYRSVVECVPIGDKRGSTIDFGDNRPSRKITQHMCVCDDLEWETIGTPRPLPNPVLSRRVGWVDAPCTGYCYS